MMNTITTSHLKALQKLDWTKIKHFYYIAKLGSFTKAAIFLDATQPGLSRQIALLERELNCSLFHRTSRGVVLTRKGEELFKVIELHFINLKAFNFNHITMNSTGEKRKIRIATTHAMAAYLLNKHLIAYKRIHPNIVFEVIAEDQETDFTLSEADFMISNSDIDIKGVDKQYLFSIEKKLFASEKYIETYGEPKTVEDLDQHHLIAFSAKNSIPSADVNWILRLGMPSGELREPTFVTNSFECFLSTAEAGEGIISSYREFDIIEKMNLTVLIPSLKGPVLNKYLHYQQYVNDDEMLVDFKSYLIDALS